MSTPPRKMDIAAGRGTSLVNGVECPLPDVIFPDEYLHQTARTPAELSDAANWFVYQMNSQTGQPLLEADGKPRFNAFFEHLLAITERSQGVFVSCLFAFFGNRFVQWALSKMQITSPYVSDSVRHIATIAFGRVIRSEYSNPGMQYFYEVISPVYEFFHQFNTGTIPVLGHGDFIQLGPLPLGLIRSETLRPSARLYSNDATGRDRLVDEMVRCLLEERSPRSRILCVGDGPGLTTFKLIQSALRAGVTDIDCVILEYNAGQIENGQRAWSELLATNASLAQHVTNANVDVNWIHGSGAHAHVPANSIDIAFSTYVVGAMGSPETVADYGSQTLSALKPGGKHFALDFYDRADDPEYETEGFDEPGQWNARTSADLMGFVGDAQIRQTYERIWGHFVSLNNALDEASIAAGASMTRRHRQTLFAHIPLLKLGSRTLTFSFAGSNERTAVFTKPLQSKSS